MNKISTAVCLLFLSSSLMAQTFGALTGADATKVPYYIDINVPLKTAYDVQDEFLSIRYNDRFGAAKDARVNISNWRRELVASFTLEKTFGLNYYRIKLGDIYPDWAQGETYTCRLIDEKDERHEFFIRIIPPPEKIDPVVNISISPVNLSCDALKGNVVDFYGQISGGKAPYTIGWYVLNNTRTDLLNQPRQEKIQRPGTASSIRVDRDPDYYVLLDVTDACGNTGQQLVHLVCEDSQKKINTVFFEKIDRDKFPLQKVELQRK